MELLIIVVGLTLLGNIWWVLMAVKAIEKKFDSYAKNDKLIEGYRAIKSIPELYNDMYKKALELAEDGIESADVHMCRMIELFDIGVRDKE